MKLSIAQVLLEEVQFAHASRHFLTQSAGESSESPVDVRVDLRKGETGTEAVVRLRMVGQAPYAFTVSYLVLFKLDFEGSSSPDELDKRLLVTGATMAMPFVRELVANLSSRGKFGATWLAPTDFSQLLLNVESAEPAEASLP